MNEDQLARVRVLYREDICAFVEEEFGVKLESYQRKVLVDFASGKSHAKQVMKSSAGVGKSAALAWCMLWFLFCFDHAQGVAISMTLDNLRDGLWKEANYWLGKSELLSNFFDMNQKRIFSKEFDKTWFISARTYDKKADRSRAGEILSGFHSRHMAYFIDEAGGIFPEVGKSIEQGFAERDSTFVRAIFAGNPMNKDSLLYKETKDEKNFVIGITSDPDDPNRSSRIDKEWAADQIRRLGRDDPWVKVFILAEFPDVAVQSLLDESDVEAAMERPERGVDVSGRELRLGVDVARFGPDSNVFFPRRGMLAYSFELIRNARTSELYRKVVEMEGRLSVDQVFVDCTGGYGGGLADMLIEGGWYPMEVNAGSRADNEDRFFNLRSEMYFRMSEWVKRGGILPRDIGLKQELTGIMYGYDLKGRIKLEAKDQMKKRLGYSPDKADALCLTFAVREGTVDKVENWWPSKEDEEEEMDIYDRAASRN